MSTFGTILVVAVLAMLIGIYRAVRWRRWESPRALRMRRLASLLGEPHGRNSDGYFTDTGQLTMQILSGMAKLGHRSVAQPVRALAPHINIDGIDQDIDTISMFEPVILADIEDYVRKNGARLRWKLAEPPSFTFTRNPNGTPGRLTISRGVAEPRAEAATAASSTSMQSRTSHADSGAHHRTRTLILGARNIDEAAARSTPLITATVGSRLLRSESATADDTTDSAMWENMRPRSAIQGTATPYGTRPVRRTSAYASSSRADPIAGAAQRLYRVGGGSIYTLAPGVNVIGRDTTCDIVCAFDDTISAVHAEVVVGDDGVTIVRDCGSSNGTTVDGKPVSATTRLNHGSVVMIGTTQLRYTVGDSPLVATKKVGDGA
jgi:hypothetical protein